MQMLIVISLSSSREDDKGKSQVIENLLSIFILQNSTFCRNDLFNPVSKVILDQIAKAFAFVPSSKNSHLV